MRQDFAGLTFRQVAILAMFQRFRGYSADGQFFISMSLIRRRFRIGNREAWNDVRALRDENVLLIVPCKVRRHL